MTGKIYHMEVAHQDQPQKLLVSVNSNSDQPYVHIQLFDGILRKLLPEHIRYRGWTGYRTLPLYRDLFIRKLLDRLAMEVEKELNTQRAVIRSLLDFLR
jgi:hypothetical protein